MCSFISTSLHVEECGRLVLDVFSHRGPQERFLYSVNLFPLRGNEFRLNAGRFSRFKHGRLSHSAVLPFRENVAEIVDWIDQNIEQEWAMQGYPENAHSLLLEFSFTDAAEAAYFSLRWT